MILKSYVVHAFNVHFPERKDTKAACEGGHSTTAQLLIEKGADLNKQDIVRMTIKPVRASCK